MSYILKVEQQIKPTATGGFSSGRRGHWPVAILAIGFVAASGQESERIATPKPDKSVYNLLNPTPPGHMREMSTDRPDKTESAYTVDAGHFQIEMDLLSYAYDHDRAEGTNQRRDEWAVAPMNLKAGLLNDVDFQLVLETFGWRRTKDLTTGEILDQSGFGDLTLRLKKNFWGNDEGKTALTIMPFVKLPTNQDDLGNDDVEGGVIFPYAVELPAGFGLAGMSEFDLMHDEPGSGYHAEFINTITAGHQIIGNLDGYVEFYSAVSTENESRWVGTFDLGLTYAWTDNLQLDAGVNIGVTESADDVNPFIGLSYRF